MGKGAVRARAHADGAHASLAHPTVSVPMTRLLFVLAAFVLSVVAGDFYFFPSPWVTQPLVIKWLLQALSALSPSQ